MIHVCHVRDWPTNPTIFDIYCGRRYTSARFFFDKSPLHNRFRLKGESRFDCINRFAIDFRQRLLADPIVKAEFERLLALVKRGALRLWCWCAPKPCHCDVIKAELEARL